MTDAELRKIAADAAAIVTNGRNEEYGGPEDSFAVIADLWSAYLTHVDGELTEVDVARMMQLLKMARRITAKTVKIDSFLDGVGYLLCEAKICVDAADDSL